MTLQTLLRERFDKLLTYSTKGYDSEVADQIFDKIIAAYQEGQRKYHTLEHLVDLFETLDKDVARDLQEDTAIAYAFFFWHDIIYQTNSLEAIKQNEELSAQIAEQDLRALGFSSSVIQRVADIIRASAHHQIENDELAAIF